MPRLSLSGQLLLLQMGIVVLVVLAVAGVSTAQTDATLRKSESRRMLSSAESIAKNDVVRQQLASGDPGQALRTEAEVGRSFAGATYVLTLDAAGRIRSSTLPLPAGTTLPVGARTRLSGRAWTGIAQRYGDRAIEAHVPVIGAREPRLGHRLGYVVVGKRYPSWWQVLATAAPKVLGYLALAAVIGIVGSLLLSRRVKRQTLGLEPREITALVEQREAMLHGVREGVVGVDLQGRLTFANDEAVRLLELDGSPVGRRVTDLGQSAELTRILTGASGGRDIVAAVSHRLLVLNSMPVRIHGTRTGSVVSMRDRTELLDLQHQLSLAQHGTDTLRAQVHEFRNRLHVISGMVELDQRQELLQFIGALSQDMESRVREVSRRVEDPAVVALLVAKASRAAEVGVRFSLAETSVLHHHDPELTADLVTVIGNLVDNAFEAVGSVGEHAVTVDLADDGGTVMVAVTDTGGGIDPELAARVFEPGWSSKSGAEPRAHGWGLALTRLACQRHHGDVRVDAEAPSRVVATLHYGLPGATCAKEVPA